MAEEEKIKEEGMVDRVLKRSFDIILSICALFFFAPLMLIAAIAIKLRL